jgi:hypothetical protein
MPLPNFEKVKEKYNEIVVIVRDRFRYNSRDTNYFDFVDSGVSKSYFEKEVSIRSGVICPSMHFKCVHYYVNENNQYFTFNKKKMDYFYNLCACTIFLVHAFCIHNKLCVNPSICKKKQCCQNCCNDNRRCRKCYSDNLKKCEFCIYSKIHSRIKEDAEKLFAYVRRVIYNTNSTNEEVVKYLDILKCASGAIEARIMNRKTNEFAGNL